MKPIENEIPIRAIPFVRSAIDERSVMMAVHRLILPLLSPPTVLEAKKRKKEFPEHIHRM